MKPRIMIVDDEDAIRKLLQSRLEREGFDVVTCQSAPEAQAEFSKNGTVGVLVTDLKMPGMDGFELTEWARKESSNVRVIVITGHGEKDAAIRALKVGAADYLEKPFDMDEFSMSVRRAYEEFRLSLDNQNLLDRLETRAKRIEGIKEDEVWYVSKSPAMEKVNDWLNVLRRESLRGEAEEPNVLIMGESGTGKEGIARMIHQGSRRARGPWVAVNCANFTEQLLESELFGHEKGAFTGASSLKRGLVEIAQEGTLFLDEIGEMDGKLQARLLRVLQEKSFRRVGGTVSIESDIRVVAATNRNLENQIRDGKFRDDLYHRLNKVVIQLPVLHRRDDDILPMAQQFAEKAFRERGKTFSGFTPDAESALRNYAWPGNVRELWNVVERTALLWEGTGPINLHNLSIPQSAALRGSPPQLESVANPFSAPVESGADGYMNLKKKWCDSFEKEYLQASLRRHGGNVSAAAREARLDRSNFLRLLRRHTLKAQEFRKAA